MIGFFCALFLHVISNRIKYNSLQFFIFFGTYFGISDEEHKKSFL